MSMLPSGLPEQIEDDEDLARFLYSSRQFTTTGVKHVAFLPNPKDSETSVFRHGLKPLREMWRLGSDARPDMPLHGVAIVKAAEVRRIFLEVFADEPPLRHAAIRNWPNDSDVELEKAKRKELALQLAIAASPPTVRQPKLQTNFQ